MLIPGPIASDSSVHGAPEKKNTVKMNVKQLYFSKDITKARQAIG